MQSPSRGPIVLSTIVVVEDEPLIAMMMEDVLAGRGHQVVSFASAEKALAYLATGARADLLFSDVNLAGDIDGALLAILAQQLQPSLPVVLTSGRAAPELQGEGAFFIAKPYDPDKAAELIEGLLAGALELRRAVG